MKYYTNGYGIKLGTDGEEITWGELEEALSSIFHPGSSALEIRRDLEGALAEGAVEGDVEVLVAVLANTDPASVLGSVRDGLSHPANADPQGWADAYNQVTA